MIKLKFKQIGNHFPRSQLWCEYAAKAIKMGIRKSLFYCSVQHRDGFVPRHDARVAVRLNHGHPLIRLS